jgi:hypothetical protein
MWPLHSLCNFKSRWNANAVPGAVNALTGPLPGLLFSLRGRLDLKTSFDSLP